MNMSDGTSDDNCLLRFNIAHELRAVDPGNSALLSWYQVVFSPLDGSLYSRGSDYRTTIWDISTWKIVRRIGQTSDWVTSMALSPDGRIQAVGTSDGTVVIWSVVKNSPIFTFDRLGDSVRCLAFSSDGFSLAIGCDNGNIALWNLKNGRKMRDLVTEFGWIQDLSFSGNGSELASAIEKNKDKEMLIVFDLDHNREMTVALAQSSIESIRFHPREPIIAGGLFDGAICFWDSRTGSLVRTVRGHRGRVNSVAYTNNGGLLASGGKDGSIRLWSTSTGCELAAVTCHSDSVTSVAFSLDGTLLASASEDRSIKIWQVVQST